MNNFNNLDAKERFGWTNKLALLLILAIVAFYLIEEHRAHLIAYSGTILFVLFILLHVFMHLGHGGHHGRYDKVRHDHKREDTPTHSGDDEVGISAHHEHGPEDKL